MDQLARVPLRAVTHAVTTGWARMGAAVYDPMPAAAERRGMEARRRRVRTARPDAGAIGTSGDRLPVAGGSVDAVREHARVVHGAGPDAVLAEIVRVLRPNGQFLFCEHVRSDDPIAARWQDRLAGPWSVFGQGCRCNRRTLSSIEQAFGGVEVDRDEWQGMPTLVRPLVIGRAVQGTTEDGRAERSTGSNDKRPGVVESGGTK